MKRYTINTKTLKIINRDQTVVDNTMTVVEDPRGEWAKWSDVEEMRKGLLRELAERIGRKLVKGMK